jgi:hypothetical protein
MSLRETVPPVDITGKVPLWLKFLFSEKKVQERIPAEGLGVYPQLLFPHDWGIKGVDGKIINHKGTIPHNEVLCRCSGNMSYFTVQRLCQYSTSAKFFTWGKESSILGDIGGLFKSLVSVA